MMQMKLGTIIKLPDGRIGTIVYHNLDGYGGIWGKDDSIRELPMTFDERIPEPEFMLRNSYPGCASHIQCVGENYEIIGPQEVTDAD